MSSAPKRICCTIMICQMTAILSGVAMLYLSVIVVIPSKNELKMGFHTTPIMCTTVKAEDIVLLSKKKVNCDWTTCGEWCLSKGSGTCMQIYVMARNNGSAVTFRDCVDIDEQECSALDVNLTLPYYCKRGQCKELTGLFTCDKDGDNPCRDITPAFKCQSKIDKKSVLCTEKCEERLSGVYVCNVGSCTKLLDVQHYWQECERKCSHLIMGDKNVVLFSKERLTTAACKSVESQDNNTISSANQDIEWHNTNKVMLIFCSFVKKSYGTKTYDLVNEDCFNATFANIRDVKGLTQYLQIVNLHRQLFNLSSDVANPAQWWIPPESTLRLMNNTQLRINPDGCVNTLKKECKSFFSSHAHDGLDGITPDRFPCYYTDLSSAYVIGKYDPYMTYIFLLMSSAVPAALFVFSCTCLFICSKSVGVDDEGQLKITLLQKTGAGGNTNNEI